MFPSSRCLAVCAVWVTAIGCSSKQGPENIATPLDLSVAGQGDLAGADLAGADLAGDMAGLCSDPLSACGGVCVNLQDDPASCGRCDHNCGGALCTAGICQEITLTTAPTVGTSFDIATDGVTVVWSSSAGDGGGPGPHTGVYAISTTGTGQTPFPIAAPTDYTSPAGRPQAMRVAGSSAFWVNLSDPGSVGWSVYRAPVAGGTINHVAMLGTTGTIATMTLSPTATRVYVIDYIAGNMTTALDCSPAGGCTAMFDPVAGVAIGGGATAVADSTNLYWAEYGASGSVRRFHLGDAVTVAPVPLAGPYNTAANLVLDSGYLYWSDGGKIYRTPTTTASPQLVIDAVNNVAGLVAAGPYVLWGDSVSDKIRYAPSAGGGSATDLAAGNQIHYNANGGSGVLTRDASNVYWMNRGDNTIRKVALP